MRVLIHRNIAAAVGAVALLTGAVASASADTKSTTSSAGSITAWTVGSSVYYQGHANDDFGIDVLSGIAIDARWASCKISGTTGQTKYEITPAEGRQVLGTNFLAGTCLKVQYRGYTKTGTFTSTQYWNYNFA